MNSAEKKGASGAFHESDECLKGISRAKIPAAIKRTRAFVAVTPARDALYIITEARVYARR